MNTPKDNEQPESAVAVRSSDLLGEPHFTKTFADGRTSKWWIDKNLTQYAKQKLGKARVWIVKFPDDRMTRLLERNGTIIADAGGLEAMACRIDIEAFVA